VTPVCTENTVEQLYRSEGGHRKNVTRVGGVLDMDIRLRKASVRFRLTHVSCYSCPGFLGRVQRTNFIAEE
jgi:hypothetical protein